MTKMEHNSKICPQEKCPLSANKMPRLKAVRLLNCPVLLARKHQARHNAAKVALFASEWQSTPNDDDQSDNTPLTST